MAQNEEQSAENDAASSRPCWVLNPGTRHACTLLRGHDGPHAHTPGPETWGDDESVIPPAVTDGEASR